MSDLEIAPQDKFVDMPALDDFLVNLACGLQDSGDVHEATKLMTSVSKLRDGYNTPLDAPHAETAIVRLQQVASAAQAAAEAVKDVIGQR